MSQKSISWVKSSTTLTIKVDSEVYTFKKTHKNYKKLLALIDKKDKDGILNLVGNPMKKANGLFRVENNRIYMKGYKDPLPPKFATVIQDMFFKHKNIKPLQNFWKNLSRNPSQSSRESLFDFLAHNQMPITPDGHFIAYKKVTKQGKKLFDSHSKTIDNSIGKIVKMDRKLVNPDNTQTCSTGLHVASWNYAQGYTGDTLIAVKVNPRDVVAVPIDYNRQKMRTCQYKVFKKVTKPLNGLYIQTGDKDEIEGMTSKEIINFVKSKTGIKIKLNPKNKKAIIREAKKILEQNQNT
jgi:hypothetical protein